MYTEEMLDSDPYPKDTSEKRFTLAEVPLDSPDEFIYMMYHYAYCVVAWIELGDKQLMDPTFDVGDEHDEAQWVSDRADELCRKKLKDRIR